MDKVDYEKEIALYALNYAKEIMLFQHKHLPCSYPFPPLKPIIDAIRMITEGKLPWEKAVRAVQEAQEL